MGIVGIPTSVPDNDLEEIFCKTVDKAEDKINNRDIESCHRVGSQDRTNLKDIDLGNTKIFINQSLCPYYKLL